MPHVPGVNAAAITPRGPQGDINLAATFDLIDLLIKGGAAGIALLTAAGEYPAFTIDERSRLVYLAVKRSRVPVLVGIGAATLDQSLSLAREARDAGASGLLLPPPYFHRYQQDDLHEFYTQFAAHLGGGVPTFLSNQPAYASPIDPETAASLVQTGTFAGIEDASGDPQILACFHSLAGPGALILAADDPSLPAAIRTGAHGVVSAAAGAVPELVSRLDCAIRTGNHAETERLARRFDEFLAWRREFPQPVILKVALELRRIKTGGHAVPMSAARQKRLQEFREWFPQWLKG